MLEKEVAELDGDLRRVMRKIVAEAEGQQMAGNVHLSKDRYADATDAFQKAAELYRKVIDGRELLEKLAETYKKTLRARMLAQSADKKKLDEVRRFEINAEGFLEAGDIERAIAELQKACTAYEALVPKREPATLEDAVAARTAMIAARAALPEKPRGLDWPFAVSRSRAVTTGPAKPRTLSNVLEQATAAESAASKALKNREYAPARDLFVQAEKLYREAVAIQAQRDRVVAGRDSARQAMSLADRAFKTEARPASFERGKEALVDGEKALPRRTWTRRRPHLPRRSSTLPPRVPRHRTTTPWQQRKARGPLPWAERIRRC